MILYSITLLASFINLFIYSFICFILSFVCSFVNSFTSSNICVINFHIPFCIYLIVCLSNIDFVYISNLYDSPILVIQSRTAKIQGSRTHFSLSDRSVIRLMTNFFVEDAFKIFGDPVRCRPGFCSHVDSTPSF